MSNPIPRALTIAGSDSGGGAGIQADLKTFAMLGVYGMSAITSVTAQNTVRVSGVHDLPPAFVAEQIDRVAEDIGIDAAKTGMLSNAEIVRAVADAVRRHQIPNLVVDPVMVAKSGDALLREDARMAVLHDLAPLAFIITPNVPEAEVLAGITIHNRNDLREAARHIADAGPRYVLMKGGHLEGREAVDYLYYGDDFNEYPALRIDTRNTHGTGCTFSAAIAACLARGMAAPEAVGTAKTYLTEAIRRGLALGKGHGPLCHQWPLLDGVRV